MYGYVCDAISSVFVTVILCILASLTFGPENVGFLGGFACGAVGWVVGTLFISERLERWWYRQNAP